MLFIVFFVCCVSLLFCVTRSFCCTMYDMVFLTDSQFCNIRTRYQMALLSQASFCDNVPTTRDSSLLPAALHEPHPLDHSQR